MTKYKFRVWDKEDKRFIQPGKLDKIDKIIYYLNFSSEWELIGDYKNKTKIILQMNTGLIDLTGKKIYEGDLVDYWDDDGYYRVVFNNGRFLMEREDESGIGDFDLGKNQSKVRVVGNIFENPELL